jgi:hypothetical protein
LGDKDGVLWRQNRQLQDLQQALRAKDIALSTKNSEQQQIMEERQRFNTKQFPYFAKSGLKTFLPMLNSKLTTFTYFGFVVTLDWWK